MPEFWRSKQKANVKLRKHEIGQRLVRDRPYENSFIDHGPNCAPIEHDFVDR